MTGPGPYEVSGSPRPLPPPGQAAPSLLVPSCADSFVPTTPRDVATAVCCQRPSGVPASRTPMAVFSSPSDLHVCSGECLALATWACPQEAHAWQPARRVHPGLKPLLPSLVGNDIRPLCRFLFAGSEPPGAAHTRCQQREAGVRASQGSPAPPGHRFPSDVDTSRSEGLPCGPLPDELPI